MPSFECDRDCNNCLPKANPHLLRMFHRILMDIEHEHGRDDIHEIVNRHCPNLTGCPECLVDDLVHVEGCKFFKSLIKELKLDEPKPQLPVFLVEGYEHILDSICVPGSGKYSKAGLEAPEYWDIEMHEAAVSIFKKKYPRVYNLLVQEKSGDNYKIVGFIRVKELIEAADKEEALKLFLVLHPAARNKKDPINIYTEEEWQDIKI